MIDGVAFGVGVGVEVATDSRVIGVGVGVGELVIPSFDGIASNMIVAATTWSWTVPKSQLGLVKA